MQTLHYDIIPIPGSLKTWTWKQSPIWATQFTEKSQKGAQSGAHETPKMILKSIKIHTWTSKCLLGVPLDAWIIKWCPRYPKIEPPGTQNDSSASKKRCISAVKQSAGAKP